MRLSVQRRDGFRLLNLGPEGWTEQAGRLYAAEHCDGVGLTPTLSFTNLDFLRPLAGLRLVSVGAARVKDPSALFEKTDLEELGAGLNLRDLRGLSRLRKLRVLAVPYRKGIEEVAELTDLEQLQVEEWPSGAELDRLGPKPRLRDLYLQFKRTAEVSSAWFAAAPALTQLSLYSGRLRDTAGLSALTELESLRFADTKVPDLDFVPALPRLRTLELDNAGEIASRAPLHEHPALTEVTVLGRTTFRGA